MFLTNLKWLFCQVWIDSLLVSFSLRTWLITCPTKNSLSLQNTFDCDWMVEQSSVKMKTHKLRFFSTVVGVSKSCETSIHCFFCRNNIHVCSIYLKVTVILRQFLLNVGIMLNSVVTLLFQIYPRFYSDTSSHSLGITRLIFFSWSSSSFLIFTVNAKHIPGRYVHTNPCVNPFSLLCVSNWTGLTLV